MLFESVSFETDVITNTESLRESANGRNSVLCSRLMPIKSLWLSGAISRSGTSYHWFKCYIVVYSAPLDCLNQWQITRNGVCGNTYQRYLDQNMVLVIHKNTSGIYSTKFRPFCSGLNEFITHLATFASAELLSTATCQNTSVIYI